jgi:hypothetical protein
MTQDKDLAAAKAAKRKHEAALLAKPNVIAVGVGMTEPLGPARVRKPAIVVSVTELDPASDDFPEALDGVPVIVRATGKLTAR